MSLLSKKLSYWGLILGIVIYFLTIPPMIWNGIDSALFTQIEGTSLTYKVDSGYDNLNGRILYLEKTDAENKAKETQKARDDAEYREKVQESLTRILQSVSRIEGRQGN